ncbi:MAG: response regulator transcription factor [Chloroflexota bacterium]
MARIVLVDDDRSLLELLGDYLGRSGHQVEGIPDGATALVRLDAAPADLVILDVSMPGLDGWRVLQRIRATSRVPVIMLTARADEPDVLRGFAGGADDYVTKPFSFAQLAARVGAVLERASPGRPESGSILHAADLEVDVERHRVLRAGEPIDLTPTEFSILVTLMRAPGRVMSARQIVVAVWGTEYADDTGYIRRYVWHLRQKLEVDPRQPRYILNERSVGYRCAD